jgi:hypothetical protein
VRIPAVRIATLIVTLWVTSSGTAGESGIPREFPDYRCRLALPGPQYKWLDHSRVAGALAMLGDDSGTALIFMVNAAPRDFALDARFIRGFDEGLEHPGQVVKMDGEIKSFSGVPCYQVHARMEGRGLFLTGKCFAANDYFYSLQLISPDIPSQDNHLENIFSAFQFIGTPVVPQPRSAADRQACNSGYLIGQLTFYLILAVVVIWIIKRVVRRKPPSTNAPGQT